MDNSEFKALLVENIGHLDQTCKWLQELDKEVFDCLSRTVKDWANDNGWSANSDYWQDGELWIAREEWRTLDSGAEEDKFDFWFDLEVGANDKEDLSEPFDYFYTTRLCRAGRGLMGFRLKQSQIVKGREFKRVCESMAHQFADTPFFLDEDRSLFLPITVDQTALSEAIKNENIETAISCARSALDALKQANANLDSLILSIRNTASQTT